MSTDQDLGRIEGKLDMVLQNQQQMQNWFASHAKDDNTKFDELHSSVTEVRTDLHGFKKQMSIIGGVILIVYEAGKHILTSWIGVK